MKLPVLTIYQPWASLVANESKVYETRSRPFNYRGKILIHSAKKPFETSGFNFTDREFKRFAGALNLPTIYDFKKLPYGAIIAIAELVECWRIPFGVDERVTQAELQSDSNGGKQRFIYHRQPANHHSENELRFGDFRTGRFALEFRNVKKLPVPILARGKQGVWYFDFDDEESENGNN